LIDRSTPAPTDLGTQQTIDEATQPIRLMEQRGWDLDAARSEQQKVALNFLILGICRLEMLVPVAHRPSTGLRQPQGGIVRGAHQVIS
jgi:hypothetical protein